MKFRENERQVGWKKQIKLSMKLFLDQPLVTYLDPRQTTAVIL